METLRIITGPSNCTQPHIRAQGYPDGKCCPGGVGRCNGHHLYGTNNAGVYFRLLYRSFHGSTMCD